MKVGKISSRVRQYHQGNREAAKIILANPDRYPGMMQEWAHLVNESASDSGNPHREGLSEEDRNDLSDLMAWRRR